MKFNSFIVSAILAYTTAVTAVPLEDKAAVDTVDLDDGTFHEVPDVVKRDAEAEAEAFRWRKGYDNGWNSRPGQAKKRNAEAEPEAFRWRKGYDNGWNSRPGQAKKRNAEAEPEAFRWRKGYDNGWNSRPGQA